MRQHFNLRKHFWNALSVTFIRCIARIEKDSWSLLLSESRSQWLLSALVHSCCGTMMIMIFYQFLISYDHIQYLPNRRRDWYEMPRSCTQLAILRRCDIVLVPCVFVLRSHAALTSWEYILLWFPTHTYVVHDFHPANNWDISGTKCFCILSTMVS